MRVAEHHATKHPSNDEGGYNDDEGDDDDHDDEGENDDHDDEDGDDDASSGCATSSDHGCQGISDPSGSTTSYMLPDVVEIPELEDVPYGFPREQTNHLLL